MELPRPGLRKAASTDYSPKACVLGLTRNTLSMASLHGLAAEKDSSSNSCSLPRKHYSWWNMISLNPKPSPEYRREAGAPQPAPCLPQGVVARTQRASKWRCACARDRQTRTRGQTQHVGRNTARHAPRWTPAGLSTGTSQARGRDKHRGGWRLSLPPSCHQEQKRHRQTDRRTETHNQGL